VISTYSILIIFSTILGLGFWLRLTKKNSSIVGLYIAALAGAFLGAKLAYLLCEGWLAWGDPDRWRQWATGKSILGALIGGYLTVEGIKGVAGIRTITGDWFASFVPLAIAVGRMGCLTQGCCPGRLMVWPGHPAFRWPAVPVEFVFNVSVALLFWWMRRRGILRGQHFHLFMMAYGLFRFFHEPFRLTPKFGDWWSLYQVPALLLFGLGLFGFVRRRKEAKFLPENILPC
jgi:phosphatidylglycerol:prolipoprotein diacylglycerol transferase